MIADLPCSGLGVLRRKTDIKYRMNTGRRRNRWRRCREQILSVVCEYVKPGGTLIYVHLYDSTRRRMRRMPDGLSRYTRSLAPRYDAADAARKKHLGTDFS